jgi:hypothetical protein
VKKNGLLIPGRPSLGVVKYKESNCVFCDDEGLSEFLLNPQMFIDGVINQCRINPDLI